MNFYINNQTAVQEHLIKKYPRKVDENEKVYEKAIQARSFDIMRGFLPAGITTQLSWHTNLRQAWDQLCWLRHNPLAEVREIANTILNKLKEKYFHSFSHGFHDNSENYRKNISEKYNFYNPLKMAAKFSCKTNIKNKELNEYGDIIKVRPAKTNLPHFLTELGNITFDFILDFGSFRDIQRHRNGVCRMPLLTTNLGFQSWYLEQLPDNLKKEAKKLIEEQKIAINNLNTNSEISQYYIAMGFNVPCRVSYGLPAAIYVIELRSGVHVHPTLRQIAHKMHNAIIKKFPGIVLYSDPNPDDWDVRRGLQDITNKQ